MKAIATSVAILTGISKAAVGGAKLANTTVATRSMVNVSGANLERVWRRMTGICRALCSFGMTFSVVSVIMCRDDRDLRSRSACDLPRGGRDRVFLGSRAAARPAPVDGEPTGAPARSGDAPAIVRSRHPQRLADRRRAGLDRARGRDSRRLFAGRALFLERGTQGPGPLRRLGGFRAFEPAAAGSARVFVQAPSSRHRDDGRSRRRSLRTYG